MRMRMRLACGEVPASQHIPPVPYTAALLSRSANLVQAAMAGIAFGTIKNIVVFWDKCENWLQTTSSQELWRATSSPGWCGEDALWQNGVTCVVFGQATWGNAFTCTGKKIWAFNIHIPVCLVLGNETSATRGRGLSPCCSC